MSAIAAYCEHDVMWGAHAIHMEDLRQALADAEEFLEPGPKDRLVAVHVDEVRAKLDVCGECRFGVGSGTQ